MEIKIENKVISDNSPVFVIAEAGFNHNGDIELAKKMVSEAKKCGVDAIKFQTIFADKFVSKNESSYEIFKNVEFKRNEWVELKKLAEEENIIFLSSVFDEDGADMLDNLGMAAFKIASGDLTHYPLLKHVAAKNKPVILSTGMSLLEEVREALNVIYSTGNNKVILMHCVSLYPTNPEVSNLNYITTLKKAFSTPIGFSDHTLDITIPLAAIPLGVSVIEKHFTLDKELPGPDQKLSLNPKEFTALVEGIKTVKSALGNGIRNITKEEDTIKTIARRSIYSKISIQAGEKLTDDMLIAKRPGMGISPVEWNSLLGKKVNKNIDEDKMIKWTDLE